MTFRHYYAVQEYITKWDENIKTNSRGLKKDGIDITNYNLNVQFWFKNRKTLWEAKPLTQKY